MLKNQKSEIATTKKRLNNFAIINLGCAKNLTDGEHIAGLLTVAGGRSVKDLRRAELIIVNTCSFIESAREEAINTILQAAQFKKYRCQHLVICGCLSQMFGEELLREIPEADAVIGTKAWPDIVNIVGRLAGGERFVQLADSYSAIKQVLPRRQSTPHYSAWLRIADGCNNRCSYCSIPNIRGPLQSRSIELVVAEARQLAIAGVKELNIIAQDTTSYGMDWDGRQHILSLLQQLVVVPEIEWLRLLYCYPAKIDEQLLDFIAENAKVCQYLDIPLQHIADRVLKNMGRRERQQDIVKLLKMVRRILPDVALRTSLIVGFPGESEQDFSELEAFIREVEFDHVGVFKYSQEENTKAGSMSEQINEETKEDRYHRLMARQSAISEMVNQKLQGQIFTLLVEGQHSDLTDGVYGRSYRQAPEVDGKIFVEHAAGAQAGDFIHCRITQGFAYDMIAERC